MQTKLTLRLEAELIERAKRYAKERGTSVSQMVADYFQAITGLLSATSLTTVFYIVERQQNREWARLREVSSPRTDTLPECP